MAKGLPVFSLILLLSASCAHQRVGKELAPASRLAAADSLASLGKCSQAVPRYETVLAEFPVRETAMAARFGLAKCRMEMEEYDLAISSFEDFIDSYPTSDLADDARYLIAISYMKQAPRPERDQSQTVKALETLNLLLREYPGTDLEAEARQRILECRSTLAHKEYLSGELYLKMGYYKAAQIYFDSVLSDYGDTAWAAWALLEKGSAFAKAGDPANASETFEKVVSDYPGTAAADEASRRLEELGGEIGQATEASPQE